MKDVRYVEKKVAFYQNKKILTILMGLFIISIMVFSLLYYGLDSSGQEKIVYKGLNFVKTNVGWQAYTEDRERILVLSDPRDLESVSFPPVSLSFVDDVQKIYFSVDPSQDVSGALYDFQQNIPFSGAFVVACYEDSALCADLPLKTCADATVNIGVIVFQEAEETSLVLEGNCLTIQGKNLLIITDKLILDHYVRESG